MDAPLVRAFLDALAPAAPDPERVRRCLAALQRPDIRYLVATVAGPGAGRVARVIRGVVEAAGAPTGTVDGSARLGGAPLDDPLVASAGTLLADAALLLSQEGTELVRREADVLLALVAFAQASRRVALLVDEDVRTDDPLHVPVPDLVVLCGLDGERADRALSLLPDARPVVACGADDPARERILAVTGERGLPLLLAGRDFAATGDGPALDVEVAGERYAALPRAPEVTPDELATGIAGALALGALGIRMREEWVHTGAAAARATMDA
ncbi:MAG TPA: hypothetical protein VFM93_05505 [Candidatus Limnocylindria bacterium]|nr:hypothetical protein [Candidatus Limnocylindria bacterium]